MANGKTTAKAKVANGKNGQTRRNNGDTNGTNQSMRAQNVPRALAGGNENIRPVRNQLFRATGSDLIAKITVQPSPALVSEAILAAIPVSPSAYPGTRLTQYASMYQFFRFTKFHLRWVPAVPNTLACQFIVYVDLDPNADPSAITTIEQLGRRAVAQTGSQQFNFINNKRIPMPLRADQQQFFTGDPVQNLRFNTQGFAYLVQISDAVDFNGQVLAGPLQAGQLFLDWAVDFNTPSLSEEVISLRADPLPTITIDQTVDFVAVPGQEFEITGLRKLTTYRLTFTIAPPATVTGGPTTGIIQATETYRLGGGEGQIGQDGDIGYEGAFDLGASVTGVAFVTSQSNRSSLTLVQSDANGVIRMLARSSSDASALVTFTFTPDMQIPRTIRNWKQ